MVFQPTPCSNCENPPAPILTAANPARVPQSAKPAKPPRITPEQLTDVSFQGDRVTVQSTQRPASQPRRIFLFANSPRAVNLPMQSALVRLRQGVAAPLRSQGFTVLEVPNQLSLPDAIAWINRQAKPGDVALAMQTDAFFNPATRGASAFYLANRSDMQQGAELLLDQLRESLPEIVDRGARPDAEAALGSLAFTRQLRIPAIVLNVGFETNPSDRALLVSQPQVMGQGIADGVTDWVRSTLIQQSIRRNGAAIEVRLDGQHYPQQGILLKGRAYVPVNILNALKLDPKQADAIPRVKSGRFTYIRAVDLKPAGLVVRWNQARRTLAVRTPQATARMSTIMGKGQVPQDAIESFLQAVNPQILEQYPEIVGLYLEEAAIEGVSPDIAIAQALLETNFFRFGGEIVPAQNNFGGLGTVGAAGKAATFSNARLGVRAQVQQLKAYASQDPLAQELVSPRFRFVSRGVAPQVEQLSGRYSADPRYGEKVLAIVGRIYRFAGL